MGIVSVGQDGDVGLRLNSGWSIGRVTYLIKLRNWSKVVVSVMLPDDSWMVSTMSIGRGSRTGEMMMSL